MEAKRWLMLILSFLVLTPGLGNIRSRAGPDLSVLPEPSYVYVDQPYMEGHNNIVEFCGINKKGVPRHGKAICRGDWWIKPCEWKSYCSTGWEYDPDDYYPIEECETCEPVYVYVDQPYMRGHNNIVEFCGLFKGTPWHGKATCRGEWWLRPCEWCSHCSTGWEYDPEDFYPVEECEMCNKNLIAVIVNADIAPLITAELDQFVLDLQNEGYRVELETFEADRSVEELRALLQSKLSNGLIGAELIGDLPIPLVPYSVEEYGYHFFPEDLIYADLDGQWMDEDEDGLYEIHRDGSGDKEAEIWIGRLTFSPIDKDEVLCLKQYFAKNHQWRNNWPYENQKALVYADDDAAIIGEQKSSSGLREIYNVVNLINEPEQTSIQDYKNRLREDYEMICLDSHGSAFSHCFKVDGAREFINGSEILDLHPQARFYNLTTCFIGDYTADNYIGGCYLASGNGLVVFTTYGGVESFNEFCLELAQGRSVGEAFRVCYLCGVYMYDYSPLLGDPSLRIVDGEPFPVVPINIPTGLRAEQITASCNGAPCPWIRLYWEDLGDDYDYQLEKTCRDNGKKQLIRYGFLDREIPYRYSDWRVEEGATYLYRVRSRWKDDNGDWYYSEFSDSIRVTVEPLS